MNKPTERKAFLSRTESGSQWGTATDLAVFLGPVERRLLVPVDCLACPHIILHLLDLLPQTLLISGDEPYFESSGRVQNSTWCVPKCPPRVRWRIGRVHL